MHLSLYATTKEQRTVLPLYLELGNSLRTPIYGQKTFYLQSTSGNHMSINAKTKEQFLKYRDNIYDLQAAEIIEIKDFFAFWFNHSTIDGA